MVTAVARLELELAGCQSLKDKRQILRSVIERTRSRFQLAVAEVEDQDLWQRAVIGIACVSSNAGHASEVIQKAVQFVTTAHAECELLDYEMDVLQPF